LFSRNQEWQNVFGIAVLSVGMLAVGIPHGALDHLLESKVSWNKGLVVFVMKYVLTMLIMAVLWWVWPVLALLVFLLASVWHFGQADGQSWGLTPAVFILWGASVLAFVLGTHAEETHLILKGMGISLRPMERGAFLLIPWLIYAILKRNAQWILTILWLSLTAKVSLILAFGIFFIGHHSLTGWSHLKQDFKMSNWKMWTMSLPFQMGAWLFLLGFYFFWPEQNHGILCSKWGIFFIFISCVSFPHILAMHRFYRR
jgi:Brp/Blh family beta-carotene 15,15'-monooxygenase